jgi:hypothetical protein
MLKELVKEDNIVERKKESIREQLAHLRKQLEVLEDLD